MSIVDMIKTMAKDTAQSQNPVNVVPGTVKSVDPIEIEVHQKLKLTKDFILLTERVTRHEINLEHNHGGTNALTRIVIREGLKIGDGVVMLRVQGGQQYVVLDKVVN